MAFVRKKFLKMIGCLSQRNVALLMTYFYIFTFIVLIGIYRETGSVDSRLDIGEERIVPVGPLDSAFRKGRDIRAAHFENDEENVGVRHTVLRDSNLDSKVTEVKRDTNKLGVDSKIKTEENIKNDVNIAKPDNVLNTKTVIKTIPAVPVPQKKTENVGQNMTSLEMKNENIKTQSSKIGNGNVMKRTTKPKYPNVEMVPNFKFNTPMPPVKEDIWQNILADGTFLIFASYLEYTTGQPYVRGLTMNGNSYMPRFYCELTYSDDVNGDVVETVKGLKPWMLPDHHEKEFKTLFLYCPLPDDRVPKYISIIPEKEPVRLQRLPVIFNPKVERNFTVCLSPLFFNYSIEYELVQWFELNKLIGADLFMVYNYSTVGRTDEILNHYVREGWVKVIQWQLPEHTDLHYYGQVSMMNDCFLRNYKVSRYMVNFDIDELIIPRKGMTNWNQLMTSLPQDKCEYSFRSSIMAAESKNVFEGKQKARELNLSFMLRMARREYIFDKNVRSKYIVNTTCVDTVGIHYCWKYRNGTADTERYHVPPRDGMMFHFRSEPVAQKGVEIEEKAVYKYHTELITNAKLRWDKINAERKKSKS